jgi:hypothetical protein
VQLERAHIEIGIYTRRGGVDRKSERAAHLVARREASDRDARPVAHGEGNLAPAGDAVALDGLEAKPMRPVGNQRRVELHPAGAAGKLGNRLHAVIDIDADQHD